jgi:hypothetical protein
MLLMRSSAIGASCMTLPTRAPSAVNNCVTRPQGGELGELEAHSRENEGGGPIGHRGVTRQTFVIFLVIRPT